MSVSSGEQFACPQCDRKFRWKPELAGRKAKCACGTIITIPAAIEQEPDELYDFAEPEPPLAAAATPTARPSAVIAYRGSDVPPADTTDRVRSDSLYDLPRDFYWPTAVLVAGFLALLAWAAYESEGSSLVVVIFCVYITVATLIKTGVMIGVAFAAASIFGVSFGSLWTAVLKLAAMVVITDASLFWLETFMESVGATPVTLREFGAVLTVQTMAAGAVIAVFLLIFFDMDRDELAKLAIGMAVVNRVLNVIIVLVLAVIIGAVAGAVSAARSAATAPLAPAATTAPAPAPAAQPAATTRPNSAAAASNDQRISKLIVRGYPFVQEVREFYNTTLGRPNHREFVLGLYDKGARHVYFGLIAKGRSGPSELIVELPDNPSQRAGLVKALQDFATAQKVGIRASEISDDGNQFLDIPLPPWR